MTKKILSIVCTLIILLFILQINAFAASVPLGSVEVNVTSEKIAPGEEVIVNINFGTSLGAYTFDVAYDNSIFEFVSAEGGTENDNGTRVRVTYYDAAGGTNPRENMSVTFKAKEELESTNPTDFSVTAEGLANSDASQTYDDITTPIKKSVTVEPNYVDYTIKLNYTGDVVSGKENTMELITESSMGRNYDHVGMTAEIIAKPSDGATVQLLATERTRATVDLIQDGWGEPDGYQLGGKDVTQILDIAATFSEPGAYTLRITLSDKDSSNAQIATADFDIDVVEETTQTPPEDNTPEEEQPGDGVTDETPEDENNPVTNPDNNENIEGTTNGNNAEELPEDLPKTGSTQYGVIISVLAVLGCSYIVLKNSKKHD